MSRIEPRSVIAFTAIGLAHLVIILLLLTALVRSGVLSSPQSIDVFNVAGTEVAPMLALSGTAVSIPVDVTAPAFDVADDQPPKPASSPGYDPFGGAAVRSAPLPVNNQLTSSERSALGGLSSAHSADDLAWLEALKQRLRDLQSKLGTRLSPAVVEVLARPVGGFTEIRVTSKTGSEEADQQVLEAVMARQSLVPPGQVSASAWVTLPKITLVDP